MEKRLRSRKSGSKEPVDREVYERELAARGFLRVAGIDEAGRGPLAGPVVAAAVVLGSLRHPLIRDSKKLTHRQRETLYELIMDGAVNVGVGVVKHSRIDEINILNATKEAMRAALVALDSPPDHLLIDALLLKTGIPETALVAGDNLSVSIAAASIIAKVTRDRIMLDYHRLYPEYGFDRHKGYPTLLHRQRLKEHGPTPIHRHSFRPVREL